MRCEFGRPDGELLLDQTYDALCDVVLVSFMLQEAIGNYNAELAEQAFVGELAKLVEHLTERLSGEAEKRRSGRQTQNLSGQCRHESDGIL